VDEVDANHVLQVLDPRDPRSGKPLDENSLWRTKTVSAQRVRSRIELVLQHAIATKCRPGPNPAVWRGDLQALLPKPKKLLQVKNRYKRHHAMLPYDQVGEFMARLRALEGTDWRAVELLALTATRMSEVRCALWSEFNLNTATWTIPRERTKQFREQRVPLSAGCIRILKGLDHVGDAVFPALIGKGEFMAECTVNLALQQLAPNATAHGLRATFKSWAAAKTTFPWQIAEMALGHSVGSETEQAYQRDDLFDHRRELMSAWARFCDSIPAPVDNVTPLRVVA
jgi:integrase